jgi:hypothetical protein
MSRIFSINFIYEGEVHIAMVTVRKTPFFTEYCLRLSNDEIVAQLPSDKIISITPGELIFSNAHQGSTVLMNEILNAVAQHAHTAKA